MAHVCLSVAPESPKYLFMNKNDREGSKKVLIKLRDNDTDLVEAELESLENEKYRIAKQKKVNWSDFWTNTSLRRPLIVTIVIQMSQQFSGINAVLFYSTDIFKNSGLTGQQPIYASISLSLVRLIFTILCLFIIDKAGRKKLLLIGMLGMMASAFSLAIFQTLVNIFKQILTLEKLT